MSTSRAHITFPKEVRADLDRLVDKRYLDLSSFSNSGLHVASGSDPVKVALTLTLRSIY